MPPTLSFNLSNPPSVDDVRAEIEQGFLASDPNITKDDLLVGTPKGNLVEFLTIKELQHIDNILYMQNLARGTVEGIDLDAFNFGTFGIKRKPRVHGTASIIIHGEPYTEVPAGFEVKGHDTGVFRLLRPLYLDGNGTATGDFKEVDFTSKQYSAGTLSNIVTQYNNIHRVEQKESSVPGVEQESDMTYTARSIEWGADSNNGSFMAIMSKVAGLPGVTKCNGYENNTPEAVTHQGQQFPPHSVGIVAYGGLDIDIATAIHNKKPPGTVLAGEVEIPLQVGTKEIKYKFFRPTTVPLKAYVKVTLSHGYRNDYEQVIKNTLINYIASLPINQTILYSAINCVLNEIRFNFIYVEIKISKKTANLGMENIPLDFKEMPTIEAGDIQVEKTA